MKITFDFKNPETLQKIERLRGDKPAGQFLNDCLQAGMRFFEQQHTAQVQKRKEALRKLH